MPRKKQGLHASGLVEHKVTIGKDFGGKRIQKSFYGTSKLDAKKKADAYKEDLVLKQLSGDAFIKKEYTFGEWATKWLEAYKKPTVQDSTYKAISGAVKKYILPYFEKADLLSIRQIDVQRFYDTESIKPLSSSVKSKLQIYLSNIFETAIDNDLCYKNPARKIKLPEYTTVNEKHVYTEKERNAVIAYAKKQKYYDIVLLLETGMRRGELLALTWDDVDFKAKTISINKAVKSTSGEVVIGAPKSKAGYRTIIFDDTLKKMLELMQSTSNSPYIISSPASHGVYSPTNWIKREYTPHMENILTHFASKNNPVLKLTPHELRHTYGTHLYNIGVDLRTIQKTMGHADLNITSNLYIHDDLEIMRKALKK